MPGLSDLASAATGGNSSGGGASGGGAGGPVYVRGDDIDQEIAEVGGATCPNLINDRDTHPQIEFIHFGNVHLSYGNRFPHPSYKDNVTVKPAGGPETRPMVPVAKPRAIQFRSALEREAILLAVFIESAQTVFAEGEGLLGALAGAVKSLVGGSSGGVGSVKSSEMNASLQKVIAAAGKLNVASIQYHDTHKAGRDFHEARGDYRKLLAKVTGPVDKTAAPPSDDPFASPASSVHPDHQTALDHVKNAANSVKAAASNAATSAQAGARMMMEIVKFTSKALLKQTDIKIMCFALVAAQQERQIEESCHEMSLAAIRASTMARSIAAAKEQKRREEAAGQADSGSSADTGTGPRIGAHRAPAAPAKDEDAGADSIFGDRGNPFLPVWSAALDDTPAASQSLLSPDRVSQALSTFNTDPVGAAKTKLGETIHSTLFGDNFLNVPEGVDAPGQWRTRPSFDIPGKAADKAIPAPMSVSDLMALGFAKVIDTNPLPKIAYDLIIGVHEQVWSFVQSVYDALVKRPPDQEIRKTSLIQAISPDAFASTIKALTASMLENAITSYANQNSSLAVSGIQVAHVDAISSAGGDLASKVDEMFNEQATPVIIAAVKSALGDLSRQLELARQDASTTKANVMEWYLGRAPYVHVEMFCGVFFPLWGVVMRCVMSVLDGPTATALKTVLDAADKLNGVVQDTAGSARKAAEDALPMPGDGDGGGLGGVRDGLGAVSSAADKVGFRGPISTAGLSSSGLSTLTDTSSIQDDIARNLATPALPIMRGKFKLPFSSRIADGQGMDITDYDDVKKFHQWDKATPRPGDEETPTWVKAENKSRAGDASALSKVAAKLK